MAVVKNLMVRAGADFSELEQKMQSLEKKMKRWGKDLESAGKTMTAGITVPVLGAAAASFKLASDMEESLNKVNVAFGNNSKRVQDWSKTTLQAYGIAQGTALDMAALFGDMGTAMGFSTGEAATMSQSLVGLAGDLASFKNIGIDEAETALKSIFTGETESLKNLGIVMTQANLDAFALAQGMGKTTKEMTQAEQVQLRYNYVMEMTKNAQGDFARTNDGAANQMRIFTESLKEAGASFGSILLPIITPAIQKLNEMIQKFGALDEGTKNIILTVGLFAAAIGPVLIVTGKLFQSVGQITNGIKLLGSAFSFLAANPIVLIAAAITALVLGIKYLWDTNEAFRKGIISIWEGITGAIKGYVNGILKFVNALISALNSIKVTIPSWVPGFGGKSFGINIPKVPYLADGGIVQNPTLAMIGEAGPEAVVPLNKGFGGMNLVVNVYGSVGVDDIGEQLVQTLRRKGVMSLA